MKYYTKEANENDFTHFYNLAQTKTVVHKWLVNFLLSLSTFIMLILYW